MIASIWIINNLPQDREITADYFARYISEYNDGIKLVSFAKLVREQGYKTIRNNQKRLWVKQ